MDSERLAAACKQLRQDEAFKTVVAALGSTLTKEVMSRGTAPDRSSEALTEYHALQRVVASIDRLARGVPQEEQDANEP